MPEIIIKTEGLGKKYLISHEKQGSYTALRDVIAGKAKKFLRNNTTTQVPKEEFWALQDISFEVKAGEIIGIIGRNGAGKSTLLKILSRITDPSIGRVEINGRVASLLEVGTGFHLELTGRENIFLNGAILGMSRSEIKKKFDEIVEFSGVEKFLDTPVKRYSSGMYVRLAFAVAAHLEPEILVVDEVLAVGDIEFQKRCLGKMEQVSKGEGRTVLFVSHNMAAIKQLCNKGILLKEGRMLKYSDINSVVDLYLSDLKTNNKIPVFDRIDREGNQKLKFRTVMLLNEKQEPTNLVQNGSSCYFELQFDYTLPAGDSKDVHFALGINDPLGNRLFLLSSYLTGQNFTISGDGSSRVLLRIENFPLKSGIY